MAKPTGIGRTAAKRKQATKQSAQATKLAFTAAAGALLAVLGSWMSSVSGGFAKIPRENRCEACKFVVDSAFLAVEKHIYERRGDKPWGELNMRLNSLQLLNPDALCKGPVVDETFEHYVGPSDLRVEPHTTAEQTLEVCRHVTLVRERELNTIFNRPGYSPLMMIGER